MKKVAEKVYSLWVFESVDDLLGALKSGSSVTWHEKESGDRCDVYMKDDGNVVAYGFSEEYQLTPEDLRHLDNFVMKDKTGYSKADYTKFGWD